MLCKHRLAKQRLIPRAVCDAPLPLIKSAAEKRLGWARTAQYSYKYANAISSKGIAQIQTNNRCSLRDAQD
jgi:hypothetical protein